MNIGKASDLTDCFFADGDAVECAGVQGFGHLKLDPGLAALGDLQTPVAKTEIVLLFATAAFPGLVVGAALTVNGVSYRAKQISAEGDGAVSRALLSKV